jgi:signal transduction histidine kinase
MYSEAVKNQVKATLPHLEPVLNRMGENSRDMVTSMSDIVWAINPDNDRGEKLAQRIENHARDLCAVRNVKLRYRADGGVDSIRLTLEQRKNIYLVFKEALNNALKYADASEIQIRLERLSQGLRLEISDDGKGFPSHRMNTGNGIRNMQLRASEIGGEFKLESHEGTGTSIRLICPL